MTIQEIDNKIYIEIQISEFSFVKKEITAEEAGKFLRQLKSVLMKNKSSEV